MISISPLNQALNSIVWNEFCWLSYICRLPLFKQTRDDTLPPNIETENNSVDIDLTISWYRAVGFNWNDIGWLSNICRLPLCKHTLDDTGLLCTSISDDIFSCHLTCDLRLDTWDTDYILTINNNNINNYIVTLE